MKIPGKTPAESSSKPTPRRLPSCFHFHLFPRTRRQWRNAGLRWLALGLVAALAVVVASRVMIRMPGQSWRGPLPPLSEAQRELSARLRGHVEKLAGAIGERHIGRPAKLEEAAAYIERTFHDAGLAPTAQHYSADGVDVRNIIAERSGAARADEILVIGAHYDSVPGCPAANDNGSGVAALLELARHFAAVPPAARTLRLVAFVNEEPSFFQSDDMGSLVYARSCRARGEKLLGMLSLETIGYYSDAAGSQQYPFPFGLAYPDTGNFIAFVGNVGSRTFVRRVVEAFRRHARFPSQGVAAPGWLMGIGWSDHWSFWETGYPALMVTDTAPFRYPHYHAASDTPDKLDYDRLARVVEGLAAVIDELAGGDVPFAG